jgi:hypothetical protein
MVSVGLIHMSCYCGADLFYVGNTVDGTPPLEILERFETQLGSGDFGLFSSANGDYGECPHCGLLFELPDPEMLSWLPFTDSRTFTDKVAQLRQSALSVNQGGSQRAYPASDRRSY